MKILYLLHDSNLNGSSLSFIDFVKDIDKKENDIYVMLPSQNDSFISLLKNAGIKNIIIIHYKYYILNYNHRDLKAQIKNMLKKSLLCTFIQNIQFRKIYKIVKKINPDIIHSNSFAIWYGASVAEKLNIPHVWHIRELMGNDFYISHIKNKKIENLCRKSYAIYISDIVKKVYNERYRFIQSSVIYDKVYYDYKYVHKRKFLNDNICNIIYVGTLDVNKGLYEILDSIKYINNKHKEVKVMLYICGDGDLSNYITDFIKKNNLSNIKKMGFVKNLNKIRSKIDIALVSSDNEALGRTAIEAMYYENLLIGANSNQSFIKNLIIDNKSGLLYEKGNYKALADKIIYAINNKENAKQIIKYAKEFAIKKYSNSITNFIFHKYENILKNRMSD